MHLPPNIRLAAINDAAAIREIYRPYIENDTVSFEVAVPTVEEMEGRIEKYSKKHCWLVYEEEGEIIGYAYSSPHRDRPAYQWSIEVSVYLSGRFRGKGIAAQLYSTLFEISVRQGYFTALAGITMPNPASERFHEKMGFRQIAVYDHIGYKFGDWHKTIWMTKLLQPLTTPGLIKSAEEILAEK